MSHYEMTMEDFSSIHKNIKIAVITAEFNENYTSELTKKNIDFLNEQGFENIEKFNVPGALEIPGVANKILKENKADLILTFGVVIRGATTHYDYVCSETARGVMDLNLRYETPVVFGLLTCENNKQVEERISSMYALIGLKTLKTYQSI